MRLIRHRRLPGARNILVDGSSRPTSKTWGLVARAIVIDLSFEMCQPTQILESALLNGNRMRAKNYVLRDVMSASASEDDYDLLIL